LAVPGKNMTIYVSLLRAVNVGGANRVRMAYLSDMLGGMGFESVQTLLQSGNVVFRGNAMSTQKLEKDLEGKVLRDIGLRTDFFVRTASEWKDILTENPFPEEAESDPSHMVVALLKDSPRAAAWDALRGAITGREKVQGAGRKAYIVYPDGIGRSKLTPTLIEGKLGTRATSRNWNTVRKLDGLASARAQAVTEVSTSKTA